MPPVAVIKVAAMPAPLVWRRGLEGEITFCPLEEWRRGLSDAVPAVNAELKRVAVANLRACLRRISSAGWEMPPLFEDASRVQRESYDGVSLASLHGPLGLGQPGVQAVTFSSLAFANEVVRQSRRKEGVQPWVRSLFAVARAHYNAWESAPPHTAAVAFDRMRREWPEAIILEEELLYDGLDIRYAWCPRDIPALSALSALLIQKQDGAFAAANLVDFEFSVRGGGYLADPPLRVAKHRKRRAEAMLCGLASPIRASWMAATEPGHAAAMTPLPGVFVDTGLPTMPLLPWLAEYVYSYLRDASHPMWTMLTTELTADCAAVWFYQLPRNGVLVKVTPELLAAFGRLPVNELQEGVPPGRALAFVNCLVGALVFPWEQVKTRVEAGGVGLDARAVAVSYLPLSDYGFAAYEELPSFPVAV